VLHGDIKPSNFLVGRGKLKHKIYLTDFELSTSYVRNGKHIPEEARERFNGSLRFSSRAANAKGAVGRKDELESWLYCLIFMVKGELPWMHVSAKNMKDAIEEVLEVKTKSRGELLGGLPEAFREMMAYVDELKFGSAPEYGRLRAALQGVMKKNGYELDYKFDWEYI
jgi:casein kinase 1